MVCLIMSLPYIVSILDVVRVVVDEPLEDLLLVGHDALVQRRVAVVVARVGPTLLVQQAGHGANVAANHLFVDRVDLLLKLKRQKVQKCKTYGREC